MEPIVPTAVLLIRPPTEESPGPMSVPATRASVVDDEPLRQFGRAVHDRRQALNMSQAAVAEQAGLSRRFLNRLENTGDINPSLRVIVAVSRALKIDPDKLMRGIV